MKLSSIFLTATLALLAACGGGGGSTPAPVVTAPTITSFTPDNASVNYGQTVNLSWTLGGSAPTSTTLTDAVTSAAVGDVTAKTVVPHARQTVRLTVGNSAGTVTKDVSLVAYGVDTFSNQSVPPSGLMAPFAKDPSGNLYLYEDRFYKVSPTGIIQPFNMTTIPGSKFLVWSQHDNAFVASDGPGAGGHLYHIDLSGNVSVVSAFTLELGAVAIDGTIYAYNDGAMDNTITVIHPNGTTSTIVGDSQFAVGNMVLDATESNLYVVGGITGTTTTTPESVRFSSLNLT